LSFAEDNAAAVLGLGKANSEQYQSFTIDGGSGGGWIIAVAEWLHCLKLTISDPDDQIIHTTAAVPLGAQVLIRLDREFSSAKDNEILIVVNETQKLPDISSIVKIMSLEELPLYIGRFSWSNCFCELLGMEFTQLLRAWRLFGNLLAEDSGVQHSCLRPSLGLNQEWVEISPAATETASWSRSAGVYCLIYEAVFPRVTVSPVAALMRSHHPSKKRKSSTAGLSWISGDWAAAISALEAKVAVRRQRVSTY
jgi:hypothetical protein